LITLIILYIQIQVKNVNRLYHAKPIVTVNGRFQGQRTSQRNQPYKECLYINNLTWHYNHLQLYVAVTWSISSCVANLVQRGIGVKFRVEFHLSAAATFECRSHP